MNKKESFMHEIHGFDRFFSVRDVKWSALFVLLFILNGAVALFYFLMRSRLADFTGSVVGFAALSSVAVVALWVWLAPRKGERSRRILRAARSGNDETSQLPVQLQGPSEEKRKLARAKRKKSKAKQR